MLGDEGLHGLFTVVVGLDKALDGTGEAEVASKNTNSTLKAAPRYSRQPLNCWDSLSVKA